MTRGLLAIMLFAFALSADASEFWSTLWRNADQQGETLLQQGDASAAARAYADPRRKAYAKLKAGDYQGAADDLGKLHDSEADYNRGNAWAYAGKLQDALDAYDAALKSDPNNQDARHNRELVANALKQRPPQQQNAGGNKSQNDKDQNDKDQNDQKDGQQGQGASGHNEQQQGGPGQKSPDEKSPNGKSPDRKSPNGQQAGQSDSSQGKQNNDEARQGASGKNEQPNPSANNTAPAGHANEPAAAKDDSEQARRDATAATGGAAIGNGASPDTVPRSEQQIAQEQWLRSIPDDPGGLLRRKFLIEHMMRQEKARQ